MLEKIVNRLVSVKSIVTILLTLVFCYLAIVGLIGAELFIGIFTTVIGFYFGTQSERKSQEQAKTE